MHQSDIKEREKRSLAAAQVNTEPSKTNQAAAADADINNIAKAYGLGRGPLPIPPEIFDPRHYADLSEVPDLREALDLVREAERQFMQLPPDLRRMFHDSPAILWDWVNDPINADKAVELGLLARMPDPAPIVPPAGSQSEKTPSTDGVPQPPSGG